MNDKRNLIIQLLTLLSLGMAAAEILMNSQGEFVSSSTQTIWSFIFLVLTIIWAVDDSRSSKFSRSFDFDFLMYIFWPIAFPYYLISTRGTEGIPLFVGFLALWCGPWLLGLAAYVYIYNA